VHRYFYVPVAYILIQSAQKTSRSHRKTPQNGQFCTVPTGEAIYENLREKVEKNCNFLSHTDWLASIFIDGTTGSNFNVLNLEYFIFLKKPEFKNLMLVPL